MTEKVYGLHAVRALLTRHAERVTAVTIAEGREPRMAEIQTLAQKAARASSARRRRSSSNCSAMPCTRACTWKCSRCRHGARKSWSPRSPLRWRRSCKPFVLVLDGVQDPHNLGACLRTADACGALAVVIPKDRAVQLNATVRKVAAGAAETTPLAVVTNLARTLRLLKEAGLWIVGADAEAPKLAHETDLDGPIALVMGAEGAGLRQLTRETCDFLVRLPQQGSVESLNVSVATGMLLYEALRQRLTVRKGPRLDP